MNLDKMRSALRKGQEMRTEQKNFFKTKSREALGRSKTLEREFDKMAAEALEGTDLFDEGAPKT